MLQIVPKWKISAWFQPGPGYSGTPEHTIFISDHHIENVLRTIASIQFTADPLARASRMVIERVEER